MHVAFIPVGKRSEVERLLREMESQKHQFKLYKGDQVRSVWIDGLVRVLPFGLVEYVFPKEDLDVVLHTLNFEDKQYSEYLNFFKMAILRKMTCTKKAPDYKKDKKYLWVKDHVNIIPIGIREDGTMLEDQEGQYKGWKHEPL